MQPTTSTTTMNPIRAEAACRTFAKCIVSYPTNLTLADAVQRFEKQVSRLPTPAVDDLFQRYGATTTLAALFQGQVKA